MLDKLKAKVMPTETLEDAVPPRDVYEEETRKISFSIANYYAF